MKLADLFRRKKKAHWIVFNPMDVMEFAECSLCGFEIEPDLSCFPEGLYPDVCPQCKAKMTYTDK